MDFEAVVPGVGTPVSLRHLLSSRGSEEGGLWQRFRTEATALSGESKSNPLRSPQVHAALEDMLELHSLQHFEQIKATLTQERPSFSPERAINQLSAFSGGKIPRAGSGPQLLVDTPPVVDDFSGGLVEWSTTGDVTVASAEAIVGNNGAELSRMYRPFELGPGTYIVEFDFQNNLSDDFDQANNFPDTFFASIYYTDTTNSFDIDLGQFAATEKLMDLDYQGAFNVDGVIGASVKGPGWEHFTGTFNSTNVYSVLAFEFNDLNEVDNDSQVLIDNVAIVPEPATWVMMGLGAWVIGWMGMKRKRLRRDVACYVSTLIWAASAHAGNPIRDLSEFCLITTTNERTTLNRATGELTTTLDARIYNLSGRVIIPPFHVVVNLSTGPVQVVGASGGTNIPPYNKYYFDMSASLPGGSFQEGERLDIPITFKRQREIQFNYTLQPFGELLTENPPVISVAQLNYTVNEGQVLVIPVAGADADIGDTVTLLGSPFVTNMTFAVTNGNPATGSFVFSPDLTQEGVYSVMFKARDQKGYEDLETIQIVVSNVNRAPVVPALPSQSVDEGGFLTLRLGITDPDDDALTITPFNLPTNAIFNPGGQTLFWTPHFEQSGNYAFSFVACDAELCRTQNVSVIVNDVPVAAVGETNAFALNVDPLNSPTLKQRLRVTGNVNGSTNAPSIQPGSSAIINSVLPSTGEQGQTIDVTLAGQATGPFAVHFVQGSSVPQFSEGIAVNSVTVMSQTQLVANITIDDAAAVGPRAPTVETDNEFAAAIVAFNVLKGETSISGKIVDFNTTNAIPGAIVSIEGTGISTTTALDGSFTLNNIPPGRQVLIINSPNHDLIRIVVNGDDPNAQDLGNIATAATVFDPNAPASVSLLSILGRGLSDYGGVASMSKTKKTITDALLLSGGTEAGVVDEFGNQLNPKMSGPGLVSILPDGVRKMAEHLDRGESVNLSETLYPFSYGWTWTNGPPPTLAEWMETLQDLINHAWAEPNNPSNYLPILIFNPGKTLSPRPPTISPATRLNAVQNYMFVMSMLSYASIGTNAEFASIASPATDRLLAQAGIPDSLWSHVLPDAYAGPPPTNEPPQRLWTSYWRGMSVAKNNFFRTTFNDALSSYAALTGVMTAVAASADLRVGLLAMPVIGHLGTEIVAALGSLAMASRVPEAPKLLSHEIFEGPRHNTNSPGIPQVKIKFKRITNDLRNGQFLYTLYRFRNVDEGRQLVAYDSFHEPSSSNLNELVLKDIDPIEGSTFYAVTCSRLYTIGDTVSDNDLNNTSPFWNQPIKGINPVGAFIAAKQMLVSDYSDPLIVYVGSAASTIPISDIELDPISGAVYYSDKSGTADERKIYKIDVFGTGKFTTNAYTQFANPGQEGLAVDPNGDVYMLNKASQALFGGRLFSFDGSSGARAHAGQVNYYSRDLFFANPTDTYALDMGPPAFLPSPNKDLYMVDLIAGQVKRAPVMADFDPFRRVAQPYADFPYSSRPADMEHDAAGNTFILVPEAIPRRIFNDREKGPMHRPPGAPIKIDCPPEKSNPYVDPVYLHSGEFYEDVDDVHLRGVGLDFTWVRKYRSKIGITNSVQGNNWDYSYNIFIEENTNTGGILVHDGHTRSDEYQKSGTNNLWTLREFFRDLRKNLDGTYTLEFEDKGVWNFHGFTASLADGRIKESIDRHGNKLQFFYDGLGRLASITDTLNRNIVVAYNGQGFISDISDYDGRTWHYEYYGVAEPGGNAGDLKSCRTPLITGTPNGNDFPLGKTISYTYSKGFSDPNLNGNLLTVTDGRRNDATDPTFGLGPYLVNTYATNTNPDDLDYDRVVKQRWGDSADTIEMCYLAVNPTPANGNSVIRVILNDRVGHVKEYFYNEFNQCTIEREFTGVAAPNQFTTDTLNRPINKLRPTDPAYFESRYEWNSDSLKKREIFPNGNITEWIYEGELSTAVTARTRGNIREVHHLPGAHTPVGDQTNIVEKYEYDTSFGRGCCGFNFVTKATDGRGNVTFKSYDSFGNLTQVVNRISSIVEKYEYDSRGRPTVVFSPDNGSGYHRVDRFVYFGPGDGNQNGFLKQSIMDDGGFNLTTSYEYDNRGNAIRIIDPRGFDTLSVYNALDQIVRSYSAELVSGSGLRYYVDLYFDANDNVVRTDTLNMDENGVVSPTNPVFTTQSSYDILNTKFREVEEVDTNKTMTTEYQFDRNRNVVLQRFGEAVNGHQPGNKTRTIFDERDKPYLMIDAEGDPAQRTAQIDYDPNGNVVKHVLGLESPQPLVTVRVFDGFDRKTSETDPMGNVQEFHYDANSSITQLVRYAEMIDVPGSASNVLQKVNAFEYDAMSRQVRTVTDLFDPATQLPIGSGKIISQAFFTDCGQMARVVDDNGHEARSIYDTAGRLSQQIDHLTNTSTHVYDQNGNEVALIASEKSGLGGPAVLYTTTNTYDNLSRKVRIVDSAGSTNRFFYDSRHNVVKKIDARGNVTRLVYDGAGRLLRTISSLTSDGTGAGAPAGEILQSQTYDDSSRLVTRTDGAGNTTTYDFDARGRTFRVTLPDGKTALTWFDALDNVVSNKDPIGTTAKFTYDLQNRMTRRDMVLASGVATDTTFEVYQYDGLGRVLSAQDNDSLVTRGYDSVNHLLYETQDGQTVTYSYDGLDNPRRLVYPGGRTVTNTFDALNRLKTVSDGFGTIASYIYDGRKRAVRRDYLNNTRATVQYDAGRRVNHITHVRDPAGANVTLNDQTFTWDATYNKTTRTDVPAAITHTYSYDSVGRMKRSVQTGPQVIDYVLDLVGNRLSVTGGPSAGLYLRSATGPEPADAQLNQYTATPFDQRAYDANGNTTGINTGLPNQRLLFFDCANRLVRLQDVASGVTVQYKYDASGRRTRKTVTGGSPSDTIYLYDGSRIIEEQNAGHTTTATYVYGTYVDDRLTLRRGGANFFYHSDDLGNVTKMTDASGTVVEQYEYGDYGKPVIKNGGGGVIATSAVGNPYLFTGREFDPETGLYNYRERYLDPLAGRFISRDKIGAWGDVANMGNGNTYAANNPWTLTDPNGLSVEYAGGLAVGAAQGTASTVGGIVAAPVYLGGAVVYGSYNVLVHPYTTWNGLCATMNRVAAHPDGVTAGWLQELAPEFLRKSYCWEWTSEYERGKFVGQTGAEVVGAACGGQLAGAGNKLGRMLKLRGLQMYRANRPFAKNPSYIPGFSRVRRGLENRTDAEFAKMGQLMPGEYEFCRELAKKEGRSFVVVGGTVETRLGYNRRLQAITDEAVRSEFPAYRLVGKGGSLEKNLRSGLIEGTDPTFDFDYVLIARAGEDHVAIRLSEASDTAIQKRFNISKVDCYNEYGNYPDADAVRMRCGGIEFHPDGSSTRITPPWGEPTFKNYRDVYPAYDKVY